MRDLATDLLEIVGLILLVAAAATWAWQAVDPGAGLAAGGLGLLGVSALLVKLGKS